MMYDKGKPIKVTSVVISTQHSKDLNQEKVRELIIPYINKSIPKKFLNDLDQKEIYINPTGQFIIGESFNSFTVISIIGQLSISIQSPYSSN